MAEHYQASPASSGAATPTSVSGSSFLAGSWYSTFGGLMRRMSSEPTGQMKASPGSNGVLPRGGSPMRPPPLEPLVLHGFRDDTPPAQRLLTASVAEEIRIMVPERLRIEEDWNLVYSLDQDGASLATLYAACAPYGGRRGGFVIVVRDLTNAVSLCSIHFPFRMLTATVAADHLSPDLRRLYYGVPASFATLLRDRRVLPLACLRPRRAPTPSLRRYE
jgi:hypothetical protein